MRARVPPVDERRSETGRECNVLGGEERFADLELDLCVGEERDLARVAGEDASVEERSYVSVERSDTLAAERLSPDVEEVTEGVHPLNRRFGVDDPVGRVGVQPHEARGAGDERARRGLFGPVGRCDPDAGRDLTGYTVDKDRQVRVDVEEHLLAGLAGDPVDLLPVPE